MRKWKNDRQLITLIYFFKISREMVRFVFYSTRKIQIWLRRSDAFH